MSMQTGKQSICFETPPYIVSSASIVGKKEGEGPLGACFDLIGRMINLGRTHGKRQRVPCRKRLSGMAVGKAGLKKEEIRYLFSGDLLGQNMPLRLDSWITRCRSLACMVRAVPAARRFPLEQCVLPQDMQITLWR